MLVSGCQLPPVQEGDQPPKDGLAKLKLICHTHISGGIKSCRAAPRSASSLEKRVTIVLSVGRRGRVHNRIRQPKLGRYRSYRFQAADSNGVGDCLYGRRSERSDRFWFR